MRLSRTIDSDLARLRALISEYDTAGGGKLPPEPKLSEMLGITRGRLRTVLRRVEDEGLIWRHVGRGTFTGSRKTELADPDWVSNVSIGNVMAARMVLEPQLAAEAAVHATPADIQALEQYVDRMFETKRFADWTDLDQRLHRKIAEATHNVLLLRLYDTLKAELRVPLNASVQGRFDDDPSKADLTNQQHSEIVSAIGMHDPARAEVSMKSHLTAVRTMLFGLR